MQVHLPGQVRRRRLSDETITKRSSTGINPLWHMYRFIRFPKVLKQTVIIEFCRFIPSMPLKRYVYRRF